MNPIMIVFAMMMPMVFAAGYVLPDFNAPFDADKVAIANECKNYCASVIGEALDCASDLITFEEYWSLYLNSATWLPACPYTEEHEMMECFWMAIGAHYPDLMVPCEAELDNTAKCLVECYLPQSDIC